MSTGINVLCPQAGLMVDYIGIAVELKSALSQYIKPDQDKVLDLGQA